MAYNLVHHRNPGHSCPRGEREEDAELGIEAEIVEGDCLAYDLPSPLYFTPQTLWSLRLKPAWPVEIARSLRRIDSEPSSASCQTWTGFAAGPLLIGALLGGR